jgi:hypothetical protein
MPKSTDLSKFSRADLKRILDNLNDRPRKTLGLLKSVEELSEFIAASSRGESHPPALSEPDVTVSRHPAPTGRL